MNEVFFIGVILICNTEAQFSYFFTTPESTHYQFQPQFQFATPNTFYRTFPPLPTFYTTSTVQQNPQPTSPPVNVQTQFVTKPTDQFRGFAYHTSYEDGASANVIFLTGPEARQVASINDQSTENLKARTLSSNILDSNAIENSNEEIQNALTNPSVADPLAVITNFFKNPAIGLQNFYSRNGRLFTKDTREDSRYPADTVPLTNPEPSPTLTTLDLQNSTTEASNSTESTTPAEEEPAESIIENRSLPLTNSITETSADITNSTTESTIVSETVTYTTDESSTTENTTE